MPAIVIRLDPALLTDADLDLRYEIPDQLEKRSGGLISSDGYRYETPGDAMQLYLRTADLKRSLPIVLGFLASERLFGNDLSAAAMVGVSELDPVDTTTYDVVFPEGAERAIRVPGA